MGVVVRRYIHVHVDILIIIIIFPTPLVLALFWQQHPYFFVLFFRSLLHTLQGIYKAM